MKLYIRFAIAAMFISVLLAGSANAQEKTQKQSDALKAEKRWTKAYIISEVAATSGWLFDWGTSIGHYESNKLFRGDDGKYEAGKAFAFNGGITAIKAVIAWKFPKARKYLMAINFGIAPRYWIQGARNLSSR